MSWQQLIDIVSNIFSNSLVASLLGVTVGGFITYFVQRHNIEKQQRFEREKIKNEELKKNQEIKIKAYNKILHVDSTYRISEWDHHTGKTELYNKNFIEHIRPILYEVYHLLDNDVAKEFNFIESAFEEMYVMGPNEDSKWILGASYARMLKSIKKEFENIRNNRSST